MNKKPFDAIIFDLGGTLIYFNGDWEEVLKTAGGMMIDSLRESGLNLGDDFFGTFFTRLENYYRERESEYVEYTTLHLLHVLLLELGNENVPDVVLRRALGELYAVTQSYWKTEEDAISTLNALREQGYRLGMISNAGDDSDVQALVDQAGIRPFFDIILTSATEGIRKPNPKIFQKCLDFLRVTPQRSAMVGDTLVADILGAHNAGIYSIWIKRRANRPENLTYSSSIKPHAYIDALGELPDLLERLAS